MKHVIIVTNKITGRVLRVVGPINGRANAEAAKTFMGDQSKWALNLEIQPLTAAK